MTHDKSMKKAEMPRWCSCDHYNDALETIGALVKVMDASIRYDEALTLCAADPGKLTKFQTVQGDNLDTLYDDWINGARKIVKTLQENAMNLL